MIKILTLSLALFIVSAVSVYGQQRSWRDLVGVWESGADTSRGYFLKIVDSVRITLNLGKGEAVKAMYKVDFTKTPVWFDIVLAAQGRSMTMKNIIEFIDDDTFIMKSMDMKNIRPTDFSESEENEMDMMRRKR